MYFSPEIREVPSAPKAATTSAAPPRRSQPRTRAPWSLRPLTTATRAGYLDVSPHTGQLIYVVVTAGEDVLHKHSAPSPAGQGGHEDGLGIGGEARWGAVRTGRIALKGL